MRSKTATEPSPGIRQHAKGGLISDHPWVASPSTQKVEKGRLSDLTLNSQAKYAQIKSTLWKMYEGTLDKRGGGLPADGWVDP
jgi:hypothetical protein